MKKSYKDLEWNQQDRRRSKVGKDGRKEYLRCNMPEYQKAMRRLRRTFNVPVDLAHTAALASTYETKGLADESAKK